jgi:hypothetical protein
MLALVSLENWATVRLLPSGSERVLEISRGTWRLSALKKGRIIVYRA